MNVERKDSLIRIYNHKNSFPRFILIKKRALISYLVDPILEKSNGVSTVRFSNSGIALSWVRVLNEMGYIVDVVNWDDTKFIPSFKYDLIVLHGGKNFKSIFSNIDYNPPLIHFSTGSYWKFCNKQEDKRIADFKQRHGIKVARDRYIYESEDSVNKHADGIIVLGNSSVRETYSNFPVVHNINSANYPDSHFEKTYKDKDYAIARNNFLFFAGSGNIHKGLDLLIDAFVNLPQKQLYVVTVLDDMVIDALSRELKSPNIHLLGEIDMRSQQFYEVIDKCAFVILPSCSEGQPGSVIECMHQGLIPIVSKESHIDAADFGIILNNCKIETIAKAVNKMSNLEPDRVKQLAIKTYLIATKQYSPKLFRRNLKNSIKSIINSRNK